MGGVIVEYTYIWTDEANRIGVDSEPEGNQISDTIIIVDANSGLSTTTKITKSYKEGRQS